MKDYIGWIITGAAVVVIICFSAIPALRRLFMVWAEALGDWINRTAEKILEEPIDKPAGEAEQDDAANALGGETEE